MPKNVVYYDIEKLVFFVVPGLLNVLSMEKWGGNSPSLLLALDGRKCIEYSEEIMFFLKAVIKQSSSILKMKTLFGGKLCGVEDSEEIKCPTMMLDK